MQQPQPQKPLEVLFVGEYGLYRVLRPLDMVAHNTDVGMAQALNNSRHANDKGIWVESWSAGQRNNSTEVKPYPRPGENEFNMLLRETLEHASDVEVIFFLGNSIAVNGIVLAMHFAEHPALAAQFKNKTIVFIANPRYQQEVNTFQGFLQTQGNFRPCVLLDSSSRELKQKAEQAIKEAQPTSTPAAKQADKPQLASREEMARVLKQPARGTPSGSSSSLMLPMVSPLLESGRGKIVYDNRCSFFPKARSTRIAAGTMLTIGAVATGAVSALGFVGILSMPPALVIALGVVSAMACLYLLAMGLQSLCCPPTQRVKITV